MTSATTTESRIEAFIREQFAVPDSDPYFNRDVHLWEEGYVDSMGFVELVAHLESSFSISISETDLFSDSFTSINRISALVDRLASE